MIDNIHCSVLLYPKFPYDNVVHTAIHVGPRVRFIPSAFTETIISGKDRFFCYY